MSEELPSLGGDLLPLLLRGARKINKSLLGRLPAHLENKRPKGASPALEYEKKFTETYYDSNDVGNLTHRCIGTHCTSQININLRHVFQWQSQPSFSNVHKANLSLFRLNFSIAFNNPFVEAPSDSFFGNLFCFPILSFVA